MGPEIVEALKMKNWPQAQEYRQSLEAENGAVAGASCPGSQKEPALPTASL